MKSRSNLPFRDDTRSEAEAIVSSDDSHLPMGDGVSAWSKRTRRELIQLRCEVLKDHVCGMFGSVDDLAQKVGAGLRETFRR